MEVGRVEQGERLRLGLRNIYLRPTRFGLLWLGSSVALLVLGLRLDSGGSLQVALLMLVVFLLTLPLAHLNLHGLELRCGSPPPGFAGTPVPYPLLARCRGRCAGLQFRWQGGPATPPRDLDAGEHRLGVEWTPPQRGLQRPGRLRLESCAPLGLMRCWTRWEPPLSQLVYPARRPGPVRQLPGGGSARRGLDGRPGPGREGNEEWRDLRPQRPGDPPGRLAWKLVAQGRGHHAKQLEDAADRPTLLAPDAGVTTEQALEHLCERIWRLHRQGKAYGLVLGSRTIPVNSGRAQRDRCLAALAAWV
jgi:uncharacterized protein (DUF58 family)